MRTVILTTQKTLLSIQTSEPLQLVAMAMPGQTAAPAVVPLSAGANSVTVNAGVFKLISNNAVGVSAPGGTVQVLATAATKDGNWPDPQMAMKTLGIDTNALRLFVPADGRGL
ncbi:MAG TPA: hypothetical protein VHT91_16690 [Kofleriaceae bacterium]|jgi:hypothetical protein|nr:hypothetical protein [Kofleriaceae bacterium]